MPLWHEKGWRQGSDKKKYSGEYRAVGHNWRGQIKVPYPGDYTAYIWNPPVAEIRRHTAHGPCFIPNGEGGRYEIYFHDTPTSLIHAIASIEAVLAEALQARK